MVSSKTARMQVIVLLTASSSRVHTRCTAYACIQLSGALELVTEWADGASACAWETERGRTCDRCHDAEGAHFPNLVVAEVRNQEMPRREQRQAMRAAEASVCSRGIHVAC
jgi:hypothetical protein